MSVILDSSAIMAVMRQEKGWDVVDEYMDDAFVTSVNYCEVGTSLFNHNISRERIEAMLRGFEVTVLDVDWNICWLATTYRPLTRDKGLSLGDRVCLAAAKVKGWPVLTADKAWKGLDKKLGLKIEIIQ